MKVDFDITKIKMIISDFDGIFTDGTGYINSDGLISKRIHFHDVMGIAVALKFGLKVVIITGEASGAVEYLNKKFEELEVFQDVKYKIQLVKELAEKYHLTPDEILYIGDDVNDADSLLFAGVKVTVPNANILIKQINNIKITDKKGGEGVLREVVDALTSSLTQEKIMLGELCK